MKQRNLAFDLIKIIACYLVIVNHTGLYVLTYGSMSPFLVSFYSTFFIFCKIAVPLFIMVSGSLLLSRDESYQKTLTRIVKVTVPLVVLSLALFVYRNGIGSILDFFPSFLKTAAIVPFWYLYMLIGLYLVSPFIRKMVKNFTPQDELIFIGLFLVLPSLLLLIARLTGFALNKDFFSAFFPTIIGYFVAGHALTRRSFSPTQRMGIALMMVIVLIVSAMYMTLTSLESGEINYALDSISLFSTVVLSVGAFILIKEWAGLKTVSVSIQKGITYVADLTFGIYLLHGFVFSAIVRLAPMQALFRLNPIIGVLSEEVAVFALCGLMVAMLKRIPIVKHYL